MPCCDISPVRNPAQSPSAIAASIDQLCLLMDAEPAMLSSDRLRKIDRYADGEYGERIPTSDGPFCSWDDLDLRAL